LPLKIVSELAEQVEALGRHGNGCITMRTVREATGIHRNLTIEVLEYFDRMGLTLRVDDGRRLRGHANSIFGPLQRSEEKA
jgi:hypothetical protein